MLREILSPEAPLFHPGNPKENAHHPQPSTPNPRVKLAVSQLLFGLSMPVCWGWGLTEQETNKRYEQMIPSLTL